MIGCDFWLAYLLMVQQRRAIDEKMQRGLPPAEYRKWRKEQDEVETAERRHQEVLHEIRKLR